MPDKQPVCSGYLPESARLFPRRFQSSLTEPFRVRRLSCQPFFDLFGFLRGVLSSRAGPGYARVAVLPCSLATKWTTRTKDLLLLLETLFLIGNELLGRLLKRVVGMGRVHTVSQSRSIRDYRDTSTHVPGMGRIVVKSLKLRVDVF